MFDETYGELKGNFKQIDRDIKDLELMIDVEGENMEDHDIKILKNNIKAMYKIYETKLTKTKDVYFLFKKTKQKKLGRMIKYIDEYKDKTEDEINEITEDPEQVYQIMNNTVKLGVTLQMQNRAQDITEKCDEIKKLGKNVKELVEMIKEVSQIVQLQGEQINSIA